MAMILAREAGCGTDRGQTAVLFTDGMSKDKLGVTMTKQ